VNVSAQKSPNMPFRLRHVLAYKLGSHAGNPTMSLAALLFTPLPDCDAAGTPPLT